MTNKLLDDFTSNELVELFSSQAQNRGSHQDFIYKHDNPYHDRLSEFDDFVMRDEDPEQNQNRWNQSIFKRSAPLHVELGTGYGHFMRQFCQAYPEVNYIGLDYRFKRSFNLAKRLAKLEHRNFRYLRAKGERIGYIFGKMEVDALYLFFPDPWPKKRHYKKRLFQLPFLEQAHQVLKPGASLWVKTDHPGYAAWMREVIKYCPYFQLKLDTNDLYAEHSTHFLASFQTKFEKIFLKQATPIHALQLQSTGA